MSAMTRTRVPLTEDVRRLTSRQPFSVSRWGDGEWAALLGTSGATCDGQVYTAALRRDLELVLAGRPRYELGLQGFALRRVGPQIEAWLAARGLAPAWRDADVYAHASRDGRLDPLVAALRTRHVILVGPRHLAPLALFPIAARVEVPAANAHAALASIVDDTERALARQPDAVVVFSAGPAAKVAIDRLYRPGRTLLDVGSLWEPYCGLVTRRYHHAVLVRERVEVGA